MIVTVTMNPSIDISYQLNLQLDTVNRAFVTHKTPGGKGLNVTRVLKDAGVEVAATGLLGGFLGDKIRSELKLAGIREEFSEISGETRNCIAILHEDQQTEILEAGPTVSANEGTAFLEKFQKLTQTADIVTISGSLPLGLEPDFYVEMLAIANQTNTPVLFDSSGASLRAVLEGQHKPFLIKPNREELAQLFSRDVSGDLAELKNLLNLPIFNGVEWIVVSLGANGAFAKHGENFYQVSIPKIPVVNPVGSGDATIAGLAAAIEKSAGDEAILKQGNAFGMLNAMESATGKIQLTNYQSLYEKIKVIKV
ncbi:tagatose-6-phosphate kinase [Enterococcus sp. LJL90]